MPASVGPSGTCHRIVRFTNSLQLDWRFLTAWSTYYTDFPIVRVTGSAVRSWPGSGSAAHALIADGTRCRHTLPTGKPLPARARAVGRGSELHAFAGTTWYRLSPRRHPLTGCSRS